MQIECKQFVGELDDHIKGGAVVDKVPVCVCFLSVVWLEVSRLSVELTVLVVVLQSVMCCRPCHIRLESAVELKRSSHLSVLPFGS